MKKRLIDRVEFVVKAGNGGNGSISFRREKYVPKGGPDGGDGGEGGSVYLQADASVATLQKFAGRDAFEARRGQHGSKRQRFGDDGADLLLKVPVGTVVKIKTERFRLNNGKYLYGKKDFTEIVDTRKNDFSEEELRERWAEADLADEWLQVADLDADGKQIEIAKGGRGGKGNVKFKSSIETTPRFAELGEWGERFVVRLEMKVLADVGLVGLPNAGKSTLLSVLTAAKPEIADYPFTTIAPNLGVLKAANGRDVVMADIPGLIEGAHTGKGLGDEFLRHVERCKVLLHIVAPNGLAEGNEQWLKQMEQEYEAIRKEMEEYGGDLIKKPEIVVINKIDLLDEVQREEVRQFFTKKHEHVMMVSAATTEGVEELKELL